MQIPFLVLLLPIFGLLMAPSLVGLIFMTPLFLVLIVQIIFKNKPGFVYYLQHSAIISQLGLLFSWPLSKQDIDPDESTVTWGLDTPSIGKIGFPDNNIEIPQLPLGADRVPAIFLDSVIINQLFWLILGLLIGIITYKLIKINNEKSFKWFNLSIFILSLYNIGLLFYYFD